MNREEERKRIGQRIADVRKAVKWTDDKGVKRTGMTQSELAEHCGLAQSHIARIENGYYSAGLDQLQQIAEVLGCNIDLVKK